MVFTGILANLTKKAIVKVGQTYSQAAKSIFQKSNKVNAGVVVPSSTMKANPSRFSNLVASTPAMTSSMRKTVDVAVGKPVVAQSSSISSSKPTEGRSKRSDVIRTTPPEARAPTTGSNVLPVGGALTAAGLAAGAYSLGESADTGGDNMGWYTNVDEYLGGGLPGGAPVDWTQTAISAAALYGGYGLAKAVTAGGTVNTLQKLFGGGSGRKVYRRRIGVKRSDIKRLKAMSRDLHRLDKVVNAAHIADIKFSRTTKARG